MNEPLQAAARIDRIVAPAVCTPREYPVHISVGSVLASPLVLIDL